MKFFHNRIGQLAITAIFIISANYSTKAQNNLAAGDVAIASYQSDFDASNPVAGDNDLAEFEDRFSLIITKPGGIAAGTVIFFTTRGWNGPLGTWHDEDFPPNTFGLGRRAVVQWTVPAGGIAQGTEVFFINKYHDEAPLASEYYDWGAYSNYNGTTALGVMANVTPIVPAANSTDGMSLSFSGDKLLVFQTGPPAGSNAGPNNSTIRFITALLANINGTSMVAGTTNYATWDAVPGAMASNESSVPPGLVNGQTCFLMSPSTMPNLSDGITEPDNGKFSACGLSTAGVCTALQMSTIIYATNPGGSPTTPNWTYSNAVFPLGTASSLCTYNILATNTITLTSGAGTNIQTRCINTAITNITYSTTGASGATFSGLPAGVTGNWAGNVVTISGSPTTTVGSPFNYTVTLTGGCGTITATGTITVTPNNTITLTSSAGTNNQTVCINNPITNITYSTTGATGASISGLPIGVTGSWAGNVVTISGIPINNSGSPYSYTLTLTGGCGVITATGTITVNGINTLNLTSGAGTNIQTVLINTPITNITYSTTGATGATFSGLPAGVSGAWASNVVTISGSPTTIVGSPFSYTVTLTGGCSVVTTTGTITVTTCIAVNQTVSASPTSVCAGGSSTITVGASQAGVNYTLRVDPANTFVAGPTASNGPAISFNTGAIASTTTYNILAETDKYSVNLNGSQSGFAIPQAAPLDVTDNFTIEGWIKPNGVTDFGRLFNKDGCYALGISNNQNDLTFTRHGSGDFSRPFTFVNGTWYHIACTYSGGTVELFVNGTSIGTVGGVPPIVTNTAGGHIGSDASGNFNQFKGNIDNVRIWNSIRTQAQIAANQTAFLTSTGNPTLVASWWIIESTGNAKDYSSNAINSTGLVGTWQVDSPVAPCSIVLTTKPTVTITPNNTITLTSAASTNAQTVCNNTPITNITYSTTGATGATFSGLPAGVTGASAANVVTISGSPTTTVGSPFSYTVTLTGGCGTITATGTIGVNPIPNVNAVSNQTVCNVSSTTAVTLSGGTGGTVFNWTNNIPSIGLGASGTGNIASFTATNAGTSPVTATITVTPSYTNSGTTCTGTPITFTITVNPTPTVNTIANQTVCNSSGSTAVNFSGAVSGTVYNWTNNTPSIGLASSGLGNIASFTAVNSGVTPVTATITVTPSFTNAGTTCTGTPKTFTITVNPTPTVNTVTNQAICNGTSTTAVNFSGAVTGTVYNWTNNSPSIGLASSGTGNISSFAATNATNAPVTATITVTPSYTNSGTTCTGTPITFTITVNPIPTVNSVSNQVVCNGTSSTAITFAGFAPGTVYNWTNNTPSIGLGASGTGNIASFTATNATNAPVTATITVTPTFTNAGTTCTGTPITFTITVNPTPTVNAIANQVLCNTASTSAVNFTGFVPGTIYNWTNNTTSIGLPSSGMGNISSFTATNVTNAPVTATITVSPTFTNAGTTCTGTPITFTITVNPTPTVNAVNNQAICNNESTTAINFTGFASGTVYNWTNNTPSIGLASSGTGNIASFVAINASNASVTATITVTPTFTNAGTTCTGTPTTFTITVSPTPTVNAVANQTLCNTASTSAVNFTGFVAGTVYNWTNTTPSIGLAASGTGNIASFTATNATNAPVTATITVTPALIGASGNTTFNYTGAMQTFTVPAGVTSITINAQGAQGGGGNGGPGGQAEATYTVTPGEILEIWVGGRPLQEIGPGGFNGGGSLLVEPCGSGSTYSFPGGGASDVRRGSGLNNRIIVAGGGGGQGWSSGLGGSGGGLTGTNGADSWIAGTSGKGGTQIAGGIGGFYSGNGQSSPSGALGVGGNSGPVDTYCTGGAGGGGYYGGGGGYVSAGGGGSSFTNYAGANNTSTIAGTRMGDGLITLTYLAAPSCTGTPITFTYTVNPTPNAVATPSSQTICSAASISAIVLTGAVSGTTYAWTRDNNASVTGIAASGSGNISGTLTNTTAAPVTVTFTITPTANGCGGPAITATVLVNPTPNAVATPPSQTICSAATITPIVLTGGVTGTTYAWTRDNNASVTGIAASGSGNITGALTNTTTAPVTVTFTITPTANSCPGASITATVLVNPTPNAVATPPSQTICSAATISTIVLTGAVSGTTYAWTRDNTASVTGIAASGSGDIAGALTNTTAAPVLVTFTVTPSANSCPGAPITATVLVNPTPNAVATPASQTICSATTITPIILSGAVTGTTYTWTRDNNASVTGIAASGSGNISGALTNTTSAPVTVTFTVTPTANSCPGPAITATVLVNPTPNAVATPASQTICSAATISTIVLTGAVSGTTYAWTRNNTATVTGIAASGSGNITGTLTNTTTAPITVTFTITPTANGCGGPAITATVLVNPTPNAVATPASQTICSAATITPIVLTGAVSGTTYAWTRNNTATVTGIAASGSGNISGTLTNTTSAPVTVTFTITPTANGCPGPAITATVLVNPTPNAIATPPSQGICTNNYITPIVLTGSVAGTVFNWTRNNTATVTGIGAFGSGNITGILVNNTAAPITVTFTITPTANGCTGNAITATVIVNPTPIGTISISPNPGCVGSTVQLSASGGTTYLWSGPQGFASTLQNPTILLTTYQQGGQYSVTITSGTGCSVVKYATLKVNYPPIATATYEQNTACTGSTLKLHGNGAGAYSWSGPAGFTSNLKDPVIVNVTSANSGLYTLTVTSPNGCTATTTINVTINTPQVVSANPTLTQTCEGSTVQLTASGTGSFSWSGPAGWLSINQNPVITNIPLYMSGTFTVTLTANTGCSSTASVTIKVYEQVKALATATPNPVCQGQSLQLHAEGGTKYLWTGPAGFQANETDPRIDNITMSHAGSYYVFISNEGGCSGYAEVKVEVKPTLKGTAGATPNPVQEFSPVQLTSSNGVSHSWTGPLGFTSTLQNPQIKKVTRAMAGIYTVMIFNENGCPTIVKVNLKVNYTNKVTGEEDNLETRSEKISKVYPNPTNDILYFECESTEAIQYTIFDLSGKEHTKLTTTTDNYISTSNLPSGVYQIRWKPQDNDTWVYSRFVKIR